MDKTFLKRLLTGPLLLSAAAVIALGSAPAPLRAQTAPAEASPGRRRGAAAAVARGDSTSSSPASRSIRTSWWR